MTVIFSRKVENLENYSVGAFGLIAESALGIAYSRGVQLLVLSNVEGLSYHSNIR